MNWDGPTWSRYVRRWGVQDQGSWGSGAIGDVPYLFVSDWVGADVPAIDAALESLQGAPGVVIDVRMNGGGLADEALAVAGRFADRARVAELLRYRDGAGRGDLGAAEPRYVAPAGHGPFTGPVLLLVGAGVFSANETFVAAMRELPNVTVVGDTTGGSNSAGEWHDLAAGWSYTLPEAYVTTADGITEEEHGIPPHVAVPVSAADFAAGRDPVLDYAERWAAAPAVVRPPP